MAALTLVAVGVPAASVHAGRPADPQHTPIANGMRPGTGLDAPRSLAERAAAEGEILRAHRAEQLWRSPGRRAARRATRTAFRALGPVGARRALEQQHPDVAASEGALEMPRGARLDEYLSPTMARVELPSGDAGVVATTMPVAARDDAGALRATDLDLERSGDAFEPAHSAAPVSIGASADDGYRLERSGVRFVPVELDHADGEVVGASVLYDNVATDTDLVIKPTASGAETFFQIRSPEASETYAFAVEAPDGSRLEGAPAGGAAVITPRGRVDVLPPTAVDAGGRAVPMTMTIDGMTLRLTVSHRGRDVAYPVLADPSTAEWNWAANPNASQPPRWFFQGWHSHFAGTWFNNWGWGRGFYNFRGSAQYYPDFAYAGWSYQAPGTAWILQTQFVGVNFEVPRGPAGWENVCLHAEIRNLNYQVEGTGRTHCNSDLHFQSMTPTLCTSTSCARGGASNFAWLITEMHPAGTRNSHYSAFNAAAMYMSDPDKPTLSLSLDTSAWVADQRWTNSSTAPIDVRAHDPGLGIQEVSLTQSTMAATWSDRVAWKSTDVAGGCNGLCAQSRPVRNASNAVPTVGNLAEGVNRVTARAWDPAGQSSTLAFDVKVDRTAPAAPTVSGPAGTTGAGTYPLSVSATDVVPSGVTSVARVEYLQIKVDGGTPARVTGPLNAQGTMSAVHEIDTTEAGLADGNHTIEVTAVDAAGNRSAPRSFPLTVDHTRPAVTLSGAAFDGRDVARDTPPLVGPQHALHVAADDGPGGSGVRRTTVRVTTADTGALKLERTFWASCASTCPPTLATNLDLLTSEIGTGQLRVAVETHDRLANVATTTFGITVRLDEAVASGTRPSIEGAPVLGKPLTADVGSWASAGAVTHATQWRRCDGSACTAIAGATGGFYVPVAADVGKRLDVVVTATAAHDQATAVSDTTAVVERATDCDSTASAPRTGDAGTTVTAATANEVLDEVWPGSVGESDEQEAYGETLQPSLQDAGAELLSGDDTAETVFVAKDPDQGFSVGRGKSKICIKPTAVAPQADPAAVDGASAVYANTAEDSDTAVRATATGAETFTTFRSGDAGEDVAWTVDLEGDQELEKQPDGSVQIIDPTPPPLPVATGSAGESTLDAVGLQNLEQAGIASPEDELPDPSAEADVTDAIDEAGVVTDPSSAQRAAGAPDAEADAAGIAGSAPAAPGPPPTGDPAPDEPAADLAAASEDAKAIPEAVTADTEGLSSHVLAEQVAETQAEEQEPLVVGEISAPEAVDAAGDAVASELVVQGDTVVMHVDHRESGVQYPVVADPWITVVRHRQVLRCCAPVYWYEDRVVGHEVRMDLVGWWFGGLIPLAPNRVYTGNGWWWVYWGWGWVYMPNWAWAPMYVFNNYPVVRRVKVWGQSPYWVTESYLESVWQGAKIDVIEEPRPEPPPGPAPGPPGGGEDDPVAGAAASRKCEAVPWDVKTVRNYEEGAELRAKGQIHCYYRRGGARSIDLNVQMHGYWPGIGHTVRGDTKSCSEPGGTTFCSHKAYQNFPNLACISAAGSGFYRFKAWTGGSYVNQGGSRITVPGKLRDHPNLSAHGKVSCPRGPF